MGGRRQSEIGNVLPHSIMSNFCRFIIPALLLKTAGTQKKNLRRNIFGFLILFFVFCFVFYLHLTETVVSAEQGCIKEDHIILPTHFFVSHCFSLLTVDRG